MAGLFGNFGTRGRALSLGLSIALFVILTSDVSLILWESTKYRPSGSSASSYSLRLEASNEGEFRDTYSFVQSCIMSESGSPLPPEKHRRRGLSRDLLLGEPACRREAREVPRHQGADRGSPWQVPESEVHNP